MSYERQVPRAGEVFLDHVAWYVAEMEAAAVLFERLGFILTPYTEHRNVNAEGRSVLSGTANRCAMLERGYLELLTAVPGSDTVLAQQLRSGLSRYGGVHLVAFTGASAEVERTRLAEAGFDPQPVVHLRRPVVLPGGEERTTEFSVVRTPPERMPEGRIQFLEQRTPDLVWRPEWITRDNAIDALTGVHIVVSDVAATADRYAAFTGRTYRSTRQGGAIIQLDRGCIALSGPEMGIQQRMAVGSPPCMRSVALRSRDLDATRAFLVRNGVRLMADEATFLAIHPDEAAGAELFVHAEGAGDPGFAC
jgi:hypothetical protein